MADPEPQKDVEDAVLAAEAVVLPEPEAGPVVEDAVVEDVLTDKPVIPAPKPRRSGGFFGMVLGGALAAAAGFGLARYVPDGWPMGASGIAQEVMDEQTALLADLRAQVSGLTEDLARRPTAQQLADLQAALAAVPVAGADMAPQIDALDARLAELETRPASGGGISASALAKYDAELAALKALLETQAAQPSAQAEAEAQAKLAAAEAEAAQIKADAAAIAQKATISAHVAAVQVAVDTGAPFADALGGLLAAGITVPPDLGDGVTPVPTLQAVQDALPDAARAALDASLRADMGETLGDRMTSFLRTQTGVRSLTPREGTDPDAVLSRIEAAVAAGDLAGALAMRAELPSVGADALADWAALAQQRLDATAALSALVAAVK